MKRLQTAITWLCLLLFGNPCLFSSVPVKIAAEDDAKPWSFPDGSGYANEVVLAAFKAAGLAVELEVVPYARCKEMAVTGKIAACFSMAGLPEFSETIAFAEKPIFLCRSDYFFSSKRPIKARNESEIPPGSVVGVVAGYEYPQSLYALRNNGVIRIEESESEELNLKKLAAGRIDLALINWDEIKTADSMLALAGVRGQVKRAFPCGRLPCFIGFSKKHPQGMMAKKKYDLGIRRISKNGTLKKIEAKWKKPGL